MDTVIVLLIIAAVIATVVALIRGIVSFLKTTEADLNNPDGPSQSSLRQNKMMMARVMFQAVAVLLVALLMLMHSGK